MRSLGLVSPVALFEVILGLSGVVLLEVLEVLELVPRTAQSGLTVLF